MARNRPSATSPRHRVGGRASGWVWVPPVRVLPRHPVLCLLVTACSAHTTARSACTRLQTTFSIGSDPQKRWFQKRPKSAQTWGRRVCTAPCLAINRRWSSPSRITLAFSTVRLVSMRRSCDTHCSSCPARRPYGHLAQPPVWTNPRLAIERRWSSHSRITAATLCSFGITQYQARVWTGGGG